MEPELGCKCEACTKPLVTNKTTLERATEYLASAEKYLQDAFARKYVGEGDPYTNGTFIPSSNDVAYIALLMAVLEKK